ncbi:MAG: hypothetical protein IJ629_04175 [Clostridia bacterium]|nr:hypothetical protein [Clostridia bacterium]
MGGNTDGRILMFEIIIFAVIIVLLVLIAMFVYVSRKKDDEEKEKDVILDTTSSDDRPKDTGIGSDFGKFQGVLSVESMNDFMEFDEVVDNMIVRKNRTQFVMVLQCNGVNYDLMSADEKMGVEEGFVQFLNTLRFPIQLYVQSRTLNLKAIINEYRTRVAAVTEDLKKVDQRLRQARATGNKPMVERLEFEKRRKTSVLEYGQNITEYVERLSSNKNILQQKTYVILSYYTAEIGGNTSNYSKDEINNICFSELYTRSQNIISSLGTSQVTGRILNSEELAELLFVAYNRDDSELYQLNNMLDAQYDRLYSTGKDVLEKRQEKLDEEINIAAIDLTTDSILKADKRRQAEERQKELEKSQKIKEKALNLLNQYEDQLDPRIFDMATEEIKGSNAESDEAVAENTEEPKEEEKPKSSFAARRIIRKRKVDTED